MRILKYVGPGTGPVLSSPLLSTSYDFSVNAIREVAVDDAAMILVRCGRSFKDVTNAQLETYMVTRQTDVTVPVIASAAVVNNILTLTYTEASGQLDATETAEPADFAVTVNAVPNVVKKVTTTGNTVKLTLTTPVLFGQTPVLVSYTQQGAGVKQVKDLKGNKAANLTNQAVTNSTPDTPILSTAVVTGASLVLTYGGTANLHATNIPVATDFEVTVNGVDVDVTAAVVAGAAKTVTLTLKTAVVAGQTVLVSYKVPVAAASGIQNVNGVKAAKLTNQAVTNSTP
jgi:uncharacterized repeat protein (TIGR02059 family)